MNMNNLRVAKKLSIGFGAVLAVVAASSSFVCYKVAQTSEIERINSASDDAVDKLDQAYGDLASARDKIKSYVLTGTASDKAGVQTWFDKGSRDLQDSKTIVAKEAPQLLPDLNEFQDKVENYMQKISRPEIDLAAEPSTRSQAVAMMTSPVSETYMDAIETTFKRAHDRTNAWSDDCTAAGYNAMNLIQFMAVLSGILSVLIGIVMAWLIVRAISRPMNAMTATMRRLASGDHSVTVPAIGQRDEVGDMAGAVEVFKAAAIEKLRLEADAMATGRLTEAERARSAAHLAETAKTQGHVVELVASGLALLSGGDLAHRIEERFPAEYETLRADFNGAMLKLQDTMKTVAASASAIRSGSGEISTASDDLSRRTEQQAASLEETAAALDEITATVRRTAEGSKHARSSGRQREDRRGAVAPCGSAGGGGHDRHRDIVARDLADYRGDRRDRLPDEPPGTQRRGRSCAGGRRGPWFCRRGLRGSRFGPALGRSCERDKDPDLDLGPAGRTGCSLRGPDWRGPVAHRGTGGRNRRHRGRDRFRSA